MAIVSFPDHRLLAQVGPIPGIESVVWEQGSPPPRNDIEVYVATYLGGPAAIGEVAAVPSIWLVQLLTAGYDGVPEVVPPTAAIANAGGLHDASTAELALSLTLAAQRGLPEFVRNQSAGRWAAAFRPSLADRRVLVIGYGGVGRAIVRRLLPFEVQVTAVASRARPGDDLVESVHGVAELPSLLPSAEIVIVVVPLTDATRHLVDDTFLAALPDDALVVNVARGPVADTSAILRHTGRLRFALDVTDPEPLPADHPLWHAPGVLISPHVGGMSSAFVPRSIALLRDQLGRIGRGEPPAHLIRPASR